MALRSGWPFGDCPTGLRERAIHLLPGMYPDAPKRNAITALLYLLLLGFANYLLAQGHLGEGDLRLLPIPAV